jgi:hypothetical protein
MPSLLVVETSIVVDCAMSWMYWLELIVNFCLLLKLTLPLTPTVCIARRTKSGRDQRNRDPSDPLLFAVNRWSSRDRDREKSKALGQNRQMAQAGTADRGIGIN